MTVLKDPQFRLRLVKYFANEQKYSAFIAMSDDEFNDFIKGGVNNLAHYNKRVILVVPGDNPSAEKRDTAMDIFIRMFNNPPSVPKIQ